MFQVMKVPALVGCHSLINPGDEIPTIHGNYFSLRDPEIRVVNFWAENLEYAVKQFLTDGLVQIRVYKWDANGQEHRVCLIDDERIPKSWYLTSLCFTGSGGVPVEVAKEIYEYIGDPNMELQRWTDPEMYYARKGYIADGHGYGRLYKPGLTSDELVANLLKKREQEKAAQCPAVPVNEWLDPKEYPMQPGWVVKRWKSGTMWAGRYSGGDKAASCDEYCILPTPKQ